MLVSYPVRGTFAVGRATVAFGTAFTQLIPPYGGPAGATGPFLYAKLGNGKPNWMSNAGAITHVTTLIYTTSTTLHQIAIMRPKNFTYVTSVVAAAQKVITLVADPGIFSTNYNYTLQGSIAYPGAVADDGIDVGDYCCYQLPDGTWFSDTANSTYSAGSVTMTTNVPTGGISAGAPFFLFQTVADNDPATGVLDFQFDTTASTTNEKFQDYVAGICNGLHLGDPLLFYSPNPTATGKLSLISGYYGQY